MDDTNTAADDSSGGPAKSATNGSGAPADSASRPADSPAAAAWTRWLWPALLVITLTAAVTFILAFQVIPGQVQVNEGEVAKLNIRAPQKITYISQIKTKEAKDKAVLAVADVYDYDAGLAQQQKAKAAAACQTITSIRYDFQTTTEQKRDRLAQLGGRAPHGPAPSARR